MSDDALSLDDLHALPATVDVATAARAFGIGRSTAYRLARAGRFPCRVLRVGGSYRVATADLLAVLGVPTAQAASPGEEQVGPSGDGRTAGLTCR